MPQCSFFTQTQTQCHNNSADGGDYCRIHARIAERLGPRPEGCPCVRGAGRRRRWCGDPRIEGGLICAYHQNLILAREAEEARQAALAQRITAIAREFANRDPRPDWETVAVEMWRRSRLPRGDPDSLVETVARRVIVHFVRTTLGPGAVANVFAFWLGLWQAEQGLPGGVWVAQAPPRAAPPPAQRPLERLAGDTQNVHREVVVKQTNSNLDLLLAEQPGQGQDTLTWMTTWWMVVTPKPAFEDYWRVMEDVRHWYGKRTCKAENDRLFKRVLDGLVHKIVQVTSSPSDEDELFKELVKRLWEECEEAAGMCCEGHIARLANVLVGFDDAFRPPVSTGEILQTKMAAIAALALSPGEKLGKAKELMRELGIPSEEQVPWLEALE